MERLVVTIYVFLLVHNMNFKSKNSLLSSRTSYKYMTKCTLIPNQQQLTHIL